MYSPTRSLTFSTRSGSGDTLKLSWRQGLRPKVRHSSVLFPRLARTAACCGRPRSELAQAASWQGEAA
jgi:hypothetical protein